jgi:MFS family permease
MIRSPVVFLILLTGLNLLNYLDRYVFPAVLPVMQEDLHISNFEGGLAAATFLVGYFLSSPLFGKLGDTGQRKKLIAVGVLIWSFATIASGLAVGTWSLLAARAVVGVGEASYATLAPTIIDDIAPKETKGKYLAIFYVATPVGSALGYLIGGFVQKHWGWHHAFYVAGGPGIVLAFLCLLMKEPARVAVANKPNLVQSIGVLWKQNQYRRGALGYCAYTAAVGAFSFWAPKFLFSVHQMKLDKANFVFGLITVVGGIVGTLIGGVLADANERKIPKPALPPPPAPKEASYREGAELPKDEDVVATAAFHERTAVNGLLKICAIGSLIGAPLAAIAFLSPTPTGFFAVVFFCEICLFLGTSPINAVALRAVPPSLRASAMALQIFAIHLLGDLWSPAAVGLVADKFSMGIAVMLLPIGIAASAFIWWPRKREAATVS